MSKLDELRAENERLKSELAVSRENRQTAEALAEMAKSLRPLTGQEMANEFAKQDAALAGRLQQQHEECRAKLAEGPRKYWVHLAHQLPVGTTPDSPALLVGADDEFSARKKYMASMGIRKTRHEIAVMEAVAGEECPIVELVRRAEAGYIPDSV